MSKETLTRLFIGLNDQDSKKQEIPTTVAKNKIKKILLENTIEGATIYNSKGLYRHANGEQVNENTIIVELLFVSFAVINQVVKILKAELNQESIALQEIELSKCELI